MANSGAAEHLKGFRGEVRSWLATHLTAERRMRFSRVKGDEYIDLMRQWQQLIYRAGYAGFSWPVVCGGNGGSLLEDVVIADEFVRAGAPPDVFRVGVRIIGPMMIELATPEQKSAFLGKMLDGSHLWCQGFSEPEVGSDLASLRTRAVETSDGFVINGQKVWNTLGHYADYCLLLARTDPNVPKHKGLTAFIIPMDTPGVSLKPIRQINGRSDFNEVFLDNVRVSTSNVVGGIDNGWKVAIAMLGHERRGIAILGFTCREVYKRLYHLATEIEILPSGRRAIDDETVKRRLIDFGVQSKIAVLNNYRFAAMVPDGGVPGPEASIQKIQATELNKAMHAFAWELSSASDWSKNDNLDRMSYWSEEYLTSFGMTIAGGTSQILKNIIGERMLDLPR